MHPGLIRLFDRHAATCFDKQMRLGETCPGTEWRFDLRTGRLTVGEGLCCRAEVLGTESGDDGTWLWGWANVKSRFAPGLIRASASLRELGRRHGITELTRPRLALVGLDAHYLAVVACGACHAAGYFRAPTDRGAVFLLIPEAPARARVADPLARIPVVFPQAVAALAISDHRAALVGYLDDYGIDSRAEGDRIEVEHRGRVALSAVFESGRLVRMETALGPAETFP